jgi:hypothetical protein
MSSNFRCYLSLQEVSLCQHDTKTTYYNYKRRGNKKSPLKIVRLVSLLVAVVGAFIAIPEAAVVMAILGLALGIMSDMADSSNRTYLLVFAVALASVSGAADDIPMIGDSIRAIMGNMSTIVNAMALGIIIMALKDRVMG